MNQNEYIKMSLELHLFFDRIMKEHALFLETSFMEKDKELKKIANQFQKIFSNILNDVISLANNNVSNELLESNEIVTNNTLDAEKQVSRLSGINIDTSITLNELNLISSEIDLNLINRISSINKRTIPEIAKLIYFKQDILNSVLDCNLYTTNYPSLIIHMTDEARMYYKLLKTLENNEAFTNEYIHEQELFWNNIMKENALFIRGLLDPSEDELIKTFDKYKQEYEIILKKYANNINYLTDASLRETLDFNNFNVSEEEKILKSKIKSIISPLLMDHIVRTTNHFIRILESIK